LQIPIFDRGQLYPVYVLVLFLRDSLRKIPDTPTRLDLVVDGVMKDLEMDAGAVLVFDQKEKVANVRSFKSGIEEIVLNQIPLFEALHQRALTCRSSSGGAILFQLSRLFMHPTSGAL